MRTNNCNISPTKLRRLCTFADGSLDFMATAALRILIRQIVIHTWDLNCLGFLQKRARSLISPLFFILAHVSLMGIFSCKNILFMIQKKCKFHDCKMRHLIYAALTFRREFLPCSTAQHAKMRAASVLISCRISYCCNRTSKKPASLLINGFHLVKSKSQFRSLSALVCCQLTAR